MNETWVSQTGKRTFTSLLDSNEPHITDELEAEFFNGLDRTDVRGDVSGNEDYEGDHGEYDKVEDQT